MLQSSSIHHLQTFSSSCWHVLCSGILHRTPSSPSCIVFWFRHSASHLIVSLSPGMFSGSAFYIISPLTPFVCLSPDMFPGSSESFCITSSSTLFVSLSLAFILAQLSDIPFNRFRAHVLVARVAVMVSGSVILHQATSKPSHLPSLLSVRSLASLLVESPLACLVLSSCITSLRALSSPYSDYHWDIWFCHPASRHPPPFRAQIPAVSLLACCLWPCLVSVLRLPLSQVLPSTSSRFLQLRDGVSGSGSDRPHLEVQVQVVLYRVCPILLKPSLSLSSRGCSSRLVSRFLFSFCVLSLIPPYPTPPDSLCPHALTSLPVHARFSAA